MDYLEEELIDNINIDQILSKANNTLENISSTYLLLSDINKGKFLGRTFYLCFPINLELARWIINENNKLSCSHKYSFRRIIETAINTYNLQELKFLTDLGLITGYIDKNGNLTPEIQATKAYFDNSLVHPRYKRTNRPVISLSQNSNKPGKGYYLPVVRYKSLHYKETGQSKDTGQNKATGTFYFYEPDSSYFLNLGKVLITATKISATLILEGENLIRRQNSQTNYALEYLKPLLDRYKIGKFKDLDLFSSIITNERSSLVDVLLYQLDGNYIGEEMVGNFDYLDIYIYKLAREKGYDTIIFQREPGEYRAVTEIYDLRDRQDSFKCIIDGLNWKIPETNHPTIWFSDYQLLNT